MYAWANVARLALSRSLRPLARSQSTAVAVPQAEGMFSAHFKLLSTGVILYTPGILILFLRPKPKPEE